MGIAEDIKRAREERHLTQAEFGRLIGVPNYYVYRWERGVNYPSKENVAMMVAVAGLDRKHLTEEPPARRSEKVDLSSIKRRASKRKKANG